MINRPTTLVSTLIASVLLLALALPAGAGELRIYTWADYGVEGTIPMTWARHRYEHGTTGAARPEGADYSDPRPPVAEAQRVAAELLERKPGERVLFLYGIGDTTEGLYRGVDPVDALVHGPRTEPTRRWLREFFAELRIQGVEDLDYLVLDTEYGVNFWEIANAGHDRAEVLRRLQEAEAKGLVDLPEALNKHAPAKFAHWYGTPQIVTAYNAWVGPRIDGAIHDTIIETCWEFYPGVPASDYGATARAWPTIDANGWLNPATPDPQLAIVGTDSAPVTYLPTAGNRYKDLPEAQARRLAWLDARAAVRSALAVGGGDGGGVPVSPWYAWPTYGRDTPQTWADALRVDVAAGVRTILIWGEERHWSEADRQVLREIIPELNALASTEPAEASALKSVDKPSGKGAPAAGADQAKQGQAAQGRGGRRNEAGSNQSRDICIGSVVVLGA